MIQIRVKIQVTHADWPNCQAHVVKVVKTMIRAKHHHPLLRHVRKVFISIQLANDAQLQELNRTWRGADKPTNILSFAQTPETLSVHPQRLWLGDLILAHETIVQESVAQCKSFKDHLAHLLVHGILHLLGLDHERSSAQAKLQEKQEIKLLKKLGIGNPYQMPAKKK